MATFLEQLAEALIAEHGASLRDTAVVLPSQRAGLYLRKALARAAGSALWSPEIFTLASFMERVSGLRTLPMDELLFEAFEGYRSIAGDDARSFDDFLQWVPTTLSDISEADAHVVPLAGFYRDLRSWEELDWSFNTTPLSDGQQRMVRYWAMVGKLHAALNARLLAKGTGTIGLVERTAAERIATVELPWKHAWFAGLNAFNAAQWRTIDHLHSTGIAHFAWDADQYYLNDQQQEAGQQLREAIAHFGKGAIAPSAALHAEHLHLRVTRAPNTVAQAWSAADRLRELSDDERSNTAIILADETLLPALLEALSGDHGDINITMGLTLASMPAGSLLSGFRTLVAGAQESNGYFHADVERLLLHPFLRHGADASIIDAAIALIADAGHVRLSPGMIQNALGSLPRTIQDAVVHVFPQMDETTDMGTRTIALIAWAQANMRGDAFATEQLYQASIALRKAHVLMERYGHPTDPSTYATITGRLLRSARVGLFGEPLSGLQVMGALEARALDFQRVIVLGAQEGKLPANSS